jgi:hypothetical protein
VTSAFRRNVTHPQCVTSHKSAEGDHVTWFLRVDRRFIGGTEARLQLVLGRKLPREFRSCRRLRVSSFQLSERE